MPAGKILTKGTKLATKAFKRGLTEILDADTIATKAADAAQVNQNSSALLNMGKKAVVKTAAEPSTPPVHNLTKETQAEWTKQVLEPWIKENQGEIRQSKFFTNQNIGEIILDNKKKRVSTAGVEKYLDDPNHNIEHLVLKDSKEGIPDNRAIAADVFNSPEAIKTLETANEAHMSGVKIKDRYGKEITAGVNPEFLNPDSFRAGQMKAANMARQIIRKIRNLPGFKELDVQQGHPIDLIKSKGVDASAAFGAESGKANRYWNRKHIGGTIMDRGAMEELNQAPGAAQELAETVTGQGPRATRRRNEYRQLGVLTEIWNQAIIAKETKGKGMKEAVATLTKHRNAIAKGDYSALQSDFKLPGSQVTLDDMLAIQILALKRGDATAAAEQVIGERLAFEWAKANGLASDRNTLEILQKYMKHINTKIDVEDAAAKGAPKGGYRFSGMTPEEIKKAMPGRFIKLDRAGNVIPPKELTEISPGVAVGPNYKPGQNEALDNVLKKLAQDPTSLDSSGMGTSFNVNQMK